MKSRWVGVTIGLLALVLVAALVAAEAQVRQDYFLFCARAGFAAARAARTGRDAVFGGGAVLRAAGRFALERAGALARAVAAARGVAVRGVAAGRSAAAARLAAAGRGSTAAALTSAALRWTSVKRVWSPMV